MRERRTLESRELTTPKAAAAAGLVFAVFFATSVMMNRYFMSFSPAELAADSTLVLKGYWSAVASYLVPFAGIAFLWFIGVLRDRIGIHEDKFFATVFLGSGILFVAMLFAAAAVLAAQMAVAERTSATSELGREIARAMFYLYGARTAAVFTLVTSTIVFRTRALPTWAAFAGFALGLLLLLGVQQLDVLILLFPAWVALLSVLILARARWEADSQD